MLGAFFLNVKIFTVSEVLILILALVIAVVRGIPGPVFFPFRLVAVAYTDLFRGVPLILVLYMIGFGVPGLGLPFVSYLPDVTYGVISLVLVYWAYDEVWSSLRFLQRVYRRSRSRRVLWTVFWGGYHPDADAVALEGR